ncbi:cytochrome P450 monooxygenase pc-2 [Trametes polyzona]|nr:cytochrome P450 monooxygenase pc-2 [Trametes polyzona]
MPLPRKTMPAPGLRFLLRYSLTNLVPVLSVWLFSRFLQWYAGVRIPGLLVVVGALLSIPGAYALRIVARDIRIRRAARRTGTILPPRWDGRLIGNFDLLQHTIKGFQSGYVGEGMWDKVNELGHLHMAEILWDRMYVTNDANVIKTFLATDFASFEKGQLIREMVHSVLGVGVFNTDGELWKYHRTMTRPFFSRDRISHFELFDAHAAIAMERMKERLRTGYPIDFQDVVLRFTLDSAAEFLLGTPVHSLKNDLPYPHGSGTTAHSHDHDPSERFSEAVLGIQHVLAMRLRLGWAWPLAEMFKDKSEEHMRVIDDFLEPILEEAIAKNRATTGEKGKSAEEGGDTLLDHLVQLTDDPQLLHDETLNILIAGRDTTAATLSFVVYMLCLYPDVFRRLREEVLEALGSTQMPTFEDIRNLKYLRAVINETLRLYPIVPFNARVATHDTTLPNPQDPQGPRVFVPAETVVVYSAFLLHRRKDYWGPDALSFDPDRWLDERLNKYFTANPLIFIPFNAGPRICLGQQFAYNEISFFLIRLLQNFSHVELDLSAQPPDSRAPPEWAEAEGQKGMEKIFPRCQLTLFLQGGLWVKMTEATQDDS